MGLLKFGSIYKKKNKKETHVPALPSKPEPLELNLNLYNSSIDTPVTSPQSNHINNNTVPAGSGSLFDDIFAELGTKPAAKSQEKGYSVMDSDFSLAIALSQQLELDQDNMKGMTGTTKMGNNMSNKSEKKVNNDNTKSSTFLLGDDSIYSNYLKGLSVLDNNDNTSSSLSTSMFDSILNKNTTNNTSEFTTTTVTSPSTTIPSNHVTQVVLDSDISDSEDSKLSDDSEEESNHRRNGKTQRMTKGVQPIMERRDNRLLARRKIDNWSNRVDSEVNTAELNESMIERMKDRHRTQVKMAALRNQQQLQEDFNMMGYTQQQHMVPQTYVPPTMMPISPTNGVLQHPGLLMDPVQMYYPNPQLQPVNNEVLDNPHTIKPIKQVTQVPAGFLPNPTHATLAIPHPPKEEEVIDDQRQQQQKNIPQRKSYFGPLPPQQQVNVMMSQPNNQNRIVGSTSNISARLSTPPSSASSTTGKHNSSTSTLERIDDEESVHAESPIPMDTPSPVLEEQRIFHDDVAAEEADCESSAEESTPIIISSPRRKKSNRKLRQNEVPVKENNIPHEQEDSSNTVQTVRTSRSTPNLKKGKKKSTSRSSSRRNSQDFTNSETTLPTPPPLPHNSPYMNYNPNTEENLYHVPRSSSQHQLNHYQQQHRQSLRHMKSEPELPRRSNSSNTQQKMYQQQQQLNMEWERMQNHQREQMLKQQHGSGSFVPMYPMYYSSNNQKIMMMDPSLYPKQYDPYQGPAYNNQLNHSKNKVNSYYQSSR